MRRVGAVFLPTMLGFMLAWSGRGADSTAAPAPDFQEVYGVIRDHLEGISPGDLNRLAVDGLVAKLRPKVELVTPAQSTAINETPLVKTSNLFDGNVAYLRISRVDDGLEQAVRQAYQNISTNKLAGLVLDLRFTGGDDYSAAARTADLFLSKDKPLLDWGKGIVRSKEKTDAIREPVAVLMNAQTARAAEALAAVMRETGAALLLGNNSAGQATAAQDYPLNNGEHLRIATAPIHVGEGAALSTEGVKPDIVVEVSPQDELAYYADAYRELMRTNSFKSTGAANEQLGGTNRLRRPRFNEAELVRERREGFNPDGEVAASRADGEIDKPVVRDPVLARALDVLKGLAVVRKARS